jgi:hypothetical protein
MLEAVCHRAVQSWPFLNGLLCVQPLIKQLPRALVSWLGVVILITVILCMASLQAMTGISPAS